MCIDSSQNKCSVPFAVSSKHEANKYLHTRNSRVAENFIDTAIVDSNNWIPIITITICKIISMQMANIVGSLKSELKRECELCIGFCKWQHYSTTNVSFCFVSNINCCVCISFNALCDHLYYVICNWKLWWQVKYQVYWCTFNDNDLERFGLYFLFNAGCLHIIKPRRFESYSSKVHHIVKHKASTSLRSN